MKLICDTSFYYNPCVEIVRNPRFQLVGTFMNAFELIASTYFNRNNFDLIKGAVSNYLSLPHLYNHHPPYTQSIDRKIPNRHIANDYSHWYAMREILNDIRNSNAFSDFKHAKYADKYSKHEHMYRHEASQYFNEYFTQFRSQYVQNQIQSFMKRRDILSVQIKEILFDIIRELVYRDYKRIITFQMINWSNIAYFVEAFMDFNILYLSGSRGTSGKIVKIKPNDIYDLFIMLYVDRDSFYHTHDKQWTKICVSNAILFPRYIKCNERH